MGANFNFNKAILGGRMAVEPELKTTPNGVQFTSFTVAVNRRYTGASKQERQTDFINIVAWRNTAEFVVRYFRKGSSICVVGSIQVRSWTDQNGQKRYATEVVADEVNFVDSKSESAAPAQPATYGEYQQATNFEEVPDGEDLPF
jgi:single-strand DNA-binding protein